MMDITIILNEFFRKTVVTAGKQFRYSYSVEYNVKTAQQRHTIESNIEKWKNTI